MSYLLNTDEILQTIHMIETQHLDVRTITLGLSLLDCAGGNINIMPKDKDANYYQCNYALSVPELMDILVNAKDNTIIINGTQVSSKALASAIESVQKELRPAAQAPSFPQRNRFRANPWRAPRFGQVAFAR